MAIENDITARQSLIMLENYFVYQVVQRDVKAQHEVQDIFSQLLQLLDQKMIPTIAKTILSVSQRDRGAVKPAAGR